MVCITAFITTGITGRVFLDAHRPPLTLDRVRIHSQFRDDTLATADLTIVADIGAAADAAQAEDLTFLFRVDGVVRVRETRRFDPAAASVSLSYVVVIVLFLR